MAARPLLDVVQLINELHGGLRPGRHAGLEQVHPEYAADQFEISLPPADPLTTADRTGARDVAPHRQAARRRGLGVSFSPLPFAGGAGSGPPAPLAHRSARTAVFRRSASARVDSRRRRGHRRVGRPAAPDPGGAGGIGVVAAAAPPWQLGGRIRLLGLENREAAVRLIARNTGNPHGASVEIKIIDASANPYLAAAVVVGPGGGRRAARATPST